MIVLRIFVYLHCLNLIYRDNMYIIAKKFRLQIQFETITSTKNMSKNNQPYHTKHVIQHLLHILTYSIIFRCSFCRIFANAN